MATRIEPCPFCGTEHNHISHNMLAFFVVCQHCNSSGPRRRQVELAIKDWNQLSASQQQSEQDNRRNLQIQALLNQLQTLETEVLNVICEAEN